MIVIYTCHQNSASESDLTLNVAMAPLSAEFFYYPAF